MKKTICLLLAASTILSSCSVVMASNREGTDIESVQSLNTRTQLIALGAEPVFTEKTEQGDIVTYKILKEKGSIARAFMHGLLDISTLGIWEMFGTPIEGALGEKKYFSIRVTFDQEDRIQKMELY